MEICIRCGNDFDISMISKKYLDKNPEQYKSCSYCRKYRKCLNCEKEFHHKQNQTCSKKCAQELKEKSWLISCGAIHNFSKDSTSRKDWESKLLNEEGITNVFQRKEVKEKSKITCIQKYGEEKYSLTNECKEKIKKTSLKKYGVENYSKTEEWLKSFKETNLEKYGVENHTQNKEIKEKIKKTNLDKYGVYTLFLLKDFREESMMNKYGVPYASQLESVKKKIKETRSSKDFIYKMIEKGYFLDPQKLSEKELYYHLVKQETKNSLKNYGENVFGKNWQDTIGRKENHIDHIYSINEGFKNCILPHIIGSINNLRIIPFINNCIKQNRCDITLEELLEKINQ